MTEEQIQSLVQLKELNEQGILSQEEFEKEKASILNETKVTQQQSFAGFDDEHKNHSVVEKEDKNEAKPQKVFAPEKKKSWLKENWWIIVGTLAIALGKIISRL